ncbi:MAG: hypothetical protein GMKNLPBB_00159 [Myxococcota bacterium]|nr:hypothetical protein [Myxococcota bacterium]
MEPSNARNHAVSALTGAAGLTSAAAGGLLRFIDPGAGSISSGLLAAGVILLVWWTAINREPVGRFMRSRATRFNLVAAGFALVFLAGVVLLNAVAVKMERGFDWTREQVFSPSPQTIGVLAGAQQPIRAIAFYSASPRDREPAQRQQEKQLYSRVNDIFRALAFASDKFTYEIVDPREDPARALREKVDFATSPNPARIILRMGDREERVGQATDQAIANAIVRLTRNAPKTVIFTTGQGEKSIEDARDPNSLFTFAEILRSLGYKIETRALLAGDIPGGDVTLVIAAPRNPFTEAGIKKIGDFMETGGRALFLLENLGFKDSRLYRTGIEKYLEENWRVILRDDLIMDKSSNTGVLMGGMQMFPFAAGRTWSTHPIVKDLTNTQSQFIWARSVWEGTYGLPGVRSQWLVKTGPQAWGETQLGIIPSFTQGEDTEGPVSLAVAGGRNTPGETAGKRSDQTRFVVFGDASFLQNSHINSFNHRDFILASMAWLTEQDDLIRIESRMRAQSYFAPSQVQWNIYRYLAMVVLPGLMILCGAAIRWSRKRAQ